MDIADEQPLIGLPSGADIIFAGISALRGPESYVVKTDERLPPGVTIEEARASQYWAEPFKFVKLGDVTMTPAPHDQVVLANYQGIGVDDDPELVIWSMRKIVTMQRHMRLPDGIGGIGGFATVTTISSEGIEQRMLERWPGDKTGAPLRPGPMDWDRGHANNQKPGMSRLRRDMAARKEKQKLRLVT